MSAVRITLADLTAKVNEGWKKDALAEHYGLPVAQVTKLLREAGLQIRKFHRPKYELVVEEEEVVETENVVDINVTTEEIVVTEDTEKIVGEVVEELSLDSEEREEVKAEEPKKEIAKPAGW